MHVYIDDSGDAGFKFDAGSSRFLVMAACVFADPTHIEHVAGCIRECRDKNRQRREFKYQGTRKGIKACFFECTDSAQYAVRAIAIDKMAIYSPKLRTSPTELKSYAIYQLLTHHDGTIRDAKIVVDGQESKPFGMSDRRYFRENVNRRISGTVREVEFVDSKQSLPVQLADMTAGAISRHVREDEKHDSTNFNAFAKRTWRRNGGSLWRFR